MKHIQALHYLKALNESFVFSGIANLTHRQLLILLTIYLDNNVSRVREVAKQLFIPKPSISRTLDKLESLDLIRREVEVNDKRSIIIKKTVKGGKLLTDCSKMVYIHLHFLK